MDRGRVLGGRVEQVLEQLRDSERDSLRVKHLQADEERALCGFKLARQVATPPASEQCVVCLDLANYGRYSSR